MKATTTMVMVLSAASLASAGTPPAANRTPQAPNDARHAMQVAQPQVTGKITWKGAPAVAAGDSCASFKVSAWEATSGAAGSGISVGGGQDLNIAGHASGNIRQKACHYVIGGLPTGKQVYVSVTYAGPMASHSDHATGATPHFTLGDKPTAQDVQVDFTTLH